MFSNFRDGSATLKCVCESLRSQNSLVQYIILGTVHLLHNKGGVQEGVKFRPFITS